MDHARTAIAVVDDHGNIVNFRVCAKHSVRHVYAEAVDVINAFLDVSYEFFWSVKSVCVRHFIYRRTYSIQTVAYPLWICFLSSAYHLP